MVESRILSFLDILLSASVHGLLFGFLGEGLYFHCICVSQSTEQVLSDLGLRCHLNADGNDDITANCPLDAFRLALCPCHASGRGGVSTGERQ